MSFNPKLKNENVIVFWKAERSILDKEDIVLSWKLICKNDFLSVHF